MFWRKGYEGASLSDLTTAMGINRPSLYAAFGDKEALFRKVLDRYAEGPGSHALQALNEPTSRAVVEKLLRGGADLLTTPGSPRGCLLVQGALTCGNSAESMRRELISRRAASESALCRRFTTRQGRRRPPSGRQSRRSGSLHYYRRPRHVGAGRGGRHAQ